MSALVGDAVDVQLRFVLRDVSAPELGSGIARKAQVLQFRNMRVTYEHNWVRRVAWDEWADVPVEDA